MKYYIIVFKNTLDAMNAEKVLKEENFIFKMMPTPTAITQSCGICVRIEDKKYIDEIIERNIISYKGIYIKEENDFKEVI
ncbi:DUF3343 domain-containing protein [Clostridium sp. AL.422]|uniref:DUF3343 domain-containing protein n=1 Tax=Clostridium TaxID=1485 RepID=UPI00293DB6BF|nr:MULTISPECIES: DUF3343 domain-containing protein [unclassified Clostridium]MDV4150814.1 DUF3343 domain-containing protein [Clostridium sp. AL.422]